MTGAYHVVVLGAGSGGERLAHLLAEAGRRVAVVEELRVGGECPYVACMPSKAMLRGAHLRADLVEHGPRVGALGASTAPTEPGKAWQAAVAWRDRVAQSRDDAGAARSLQGAGVDLIRGHGRLDGPGRVLVGTSELEAEHLVLATGSRSVIPPIPGLVEVDYWTSDKALSSDELPRSLVVLGGGPIGCELAQLYARYEARVTLVEAADTLMPKEDPGVTALLAEVLSDSGVDVVTGRGAQSVKPWGQGCEVTLDGGRRIRADRLLVATGVAPLTAGLGLETLGLDESEPLVLDAACRVAGRDDLWAVGDVTGVAPFTHTANYQAAIVADNILGQRRAADYRAMPRCLFTDPPVASVGLSQEAARDQGLDVLVETSEVAETARATSEGRGRGLLVLVADARRGVLVGASAIGPGADEWIGEAVVAVRAEVPLGVLRDVVHPFPTFSETYEPALRRLAAATS
jgi:pyruvate/2-oxoglutarate dehydrogenase complex dihydrolipoamide dehydrogenase (E3) component